MDAPLAERCANWFLEGYIKAAEEEKMKDKIKEIQEYLEKRGINVTETAIVNAAIAIATRWGGNWVFVCEFKQRDER